ncbi:uncharacterized protein SPAPADRAFT_154714 [Spathaspora passalidarum NRRL Y-27907]|uniref:Uncharacterized protein n=1 Tax=Spathaspora passalidarum (strain NRRL Y-27907 / 11-Y1) TaxID=619300 RepID=G3AQE3_SPAPN|nr:uncharacterized protein SPAPADRAFT_154714 [Spathaspora passalidarum NRRL Y-27907]EGW31490.1 hypothetical protein SPAPADRAFT_154714 [Spathaspora passalidarum NRRL Y-27907]
MKDILPRILISFCLLILVGPWHVSSHRTCHPGRNNHGVPFTGFKITRQYKVTGGILPVSMHFLTLSHCDHGRVDYQNTIRTDWSGYVDWERPFCMLKPKLGEMLTLPVHDTVSERGRQMQDNIELDTYSDIPGFFNVKMRKLRNLLRKKVDINMEKLTNGKFVEYSGKNKFFHHEDLLSSDPQSSLEWESRNLVCYKMARRKKYAKRHISFYVPYTFVGGLFECFIPPQIKREIFQKYTSADLIQQFDFKCDPQLSRPISPLIAEDSTKRWVENKLYNLLNPGIIQTIPYLTTSTPMDLRFSSLETSDMYRDTWATKIDVNEDYVYREADLHIISQAVAKSADLLNKIISPIDFNMLLKAYNRANEREHPDAKSVLEYDPEEFEIMLSKASFDQKVGFWLSYLDEKVSSWYLRKIEHFWDKIN